MIKFDMHKNKATGLNHAPPPGCPNRLERFVKHFCTYVKNRFISYETFIRNIITILYEFGWR